MSTYRVGTILVVGAILSFPPPGRAATGVDAMQCEALRLRCSSRYYRCLASCDEREARRLARGEGSAEQTLEPEDAVSCEEACDVRQQQALDRIENHPPCTDETAPPLDPNTCQARLMQAEADRLFCHSRCQSRGQRREGFETGDCFDACDERYLATVDEIKTLPGCEPPPPASDAPSRVE